MQFRAPDLAGKIPDPVPNQTSLRPVTTCVCKPEAAITVQILAGKIPDPVPTQT